MCGDVCRPEDVDLEKHLAACPQCRKRLNALELLQSKIRDGLRLPIESPDMTDAVMSLLPVSSKQVVWRRTWVWAAAACLLTAIAVGVYFRTPKPVGTEKMVIRRPAVVSPNPAPPVHIASKKLDTVGPESPSGGLKTPRIRVSDNPRTAPGPRRIVRSESPAIKASKEKLPSAIVPLETARLSSMQAWAEEDSSYSDGRERRSRLVVSISIGNIKIREMKENIVLPIGQNPDAESIERPPLQVAARKDSRSFVLPGGS